MSETVHNVTELPAVAVPKHKKMLKKIAVGSFVTAAVALIAVNRFRNADDEPEDAKTTSL